ncbi:fibroblast growth factor receptor 3-like isoform X1 [Schistocerca gregaria]|uniref:fibroblast growth factor receptor 3-like isoform X1 n=1 Tax=Schistocerca gregaria TaxID=7010 RepID=UPI00211EAFE6|nr:fibroblast growth factor receptor 3-like isoform X1 [Schistocerca gregaria]
MSGHRKGDSAMASTLGRLALACLLLLMTAVQVRPATIYILLGSEHAAVSVQLGDTVRLECSHHHQQLQPQHQTVLQPAAPLWFRDGRRLHTALPRLTIARHWLNIKSVKCSDAAKYSCYLETDNGRLWQNITVAVKDMNCQKSVNTKRASLNQESSTSKADLIPVEGSGSILGASGMETQHGTPAESVDYVSDEDAVEGSFVNAEVPLRMQKTKVAIIGSSPVLDCGVPEEAESNITWIKHDTNEIPSIDLDNIPDEYVIKFGPHQLLELQDINVDDAGWYTCIACSLHCQAVTTIWLQLDHAMSLIADSEVDTSVDTNISLQDIDVSEEQKLYGSTTYLKSPVFSKPNKMHPLNIKAAGSSLNLKCQADGDPTPNITWYKDGGSLDHNLEVTYKRWSINLEKLQASDSGNYTCIVCNVNGCINFTHIVEVIDKHSGRQFPHYIKNITAAVNTTTELKCVPVMDNQAHILWQRVASCPSSNTDSGSESVFPSQPRGSQHLLIIPNITHNSEGWYECITTIKTGSIFTCVYLQVIDEHFTYAGKTAQVERKKVAVVGSSPTLTCDVPPGPDVHVRWIKHNTRRLPFKDLNNIPSQYIVSSDKSGQLLLQHISLDHAGWYTCLVCNRQCTFSGTTWLQVNPALSQLGTAEADDSHDVDGPDRETDLLSKPGSVNATGDLKPPTFVKPNTMHPVIMKPAGNTLRLKCQADGNPSPNITWYKNGVIPERHLGVISYRRWSMNLEDLTTFDSGNYSCVVCNELECINHTFKVDVIERYPHRPYIHSAENKTAVVNTTAELTCTTVSDLEPHIQWLRVESCPSGDIDDADDIPNATLLPQPEDDPQTLVLHNVTYDDEGWYTCIAANSLGTTYASAYLKVVDALEVNDPTITITQRPHPMLVNTLVGVLCAIFFVGMFSMVCIFKKLNREKKQKLQAIEIAARAAVVTQWTKKVIVEKQQLSNAQNTQEPLLMPIVKIEKQKSHGQTNTSSGSDLMISEYELPLDSEWEFPRELLTLGKSLGEGAFGKVVKAEAQGIVKHGVSTIVAVKMLKEGHTDAEMMDLVSEMEMMKMIGKHINIINLLGCCTQDGPLYVVVEYAPHGNLRDFLRQRRPSSGYEPAIGTDLKEKNTLTQKDLVSFAYQVARGMEYLASRRCIHRDLAARNVLVSDEYILKIADFGLARDIHCHDYYRKTTDGRLPVKWMAPEALFHRVYTTQSDVWSYGILLWEIMTLGGTPYPSVPSVEKLFQLLRSGHRMEKPPCCSLEIYMLMRDCWNYQPNERPMFSELVEDLDRILTITANEEYLDLGLPQLDTPPSSQESCQESSDDEEKFPSLL